MNKKESYIEFCRVEKTIPIFMQNGWLDAVCRAGVSWDVALTHDEKGRILGVLAYQIKQKWGLRILSEPFLSPFCGIWIKEKTFKNRHEQYHFEKKIIAKLIDDLPPFHFAHFRFSTNNADWQPFFWAGFKQTTRYTYQLNLKNEDNFFAQFNQNTQRNIRKAEQKMSISTADDLDTFLKISNLTFERQNKKSSIPHSIWQSADAFLKNNNLKTVYFARDTEGSLEGAVYIIFDKKTAYYLAGGSTETGRKNGAMHFLLHKAIEDARQRGLEFFDFEGSMLQGVESFFRGFNGQLMPYSAVWKYKNRFLELLDGVRK
jgi:Acetyltransferase (GNAT) domain